jgi:serine phosphatase RsbU (regulator of sigma subunit)
MTRLSDILEYVSRTLEEIMHRLAVDEVPTVPTIRPTEREMRTAQEVQAGFLPRRGPRLASLECAGVTVPARGVGGDYYDFLRLSPRRLAIAVGDISGKGVPAALMTASLQASLRSHYKVGAGDLVGRLESMNRLFYECTASGHFATLFLGEYDDRTRHLRYANCGHVPPLLLRDDGSLEWLASTTGVLGIQGEWRCATADVALTPGDTLVVYTDGATEAMSPARELFGEQRLADLLAISRGLPLDELLGVVVEEVRRFGGGDIADDLTLVAARPRIPAIADRLFEGPKRDRAIQTGRRARHADLHPSW